jgi:glyoxylase I family protein
VISTGVHHVSINVVDNEEARDFYVDILGFEELDRPDLGFPGSWLRIGAQQQLHLMEMPMPEAKGQHFALAVDDIDAAVTILKERGVDVPEPREIPGVCRQTFITDPSGNTVELNQAL